MLMCYSYWSANSSSTHLPVSPTPQGLLDLFPQPRPQTPWEVRQGVVQHDTVEACAAGVEHLEVGRTPPSCIVLFFGLLAAVQGSPRELYRVQRVGPEWHVSTVCVCEMADCAAVSGT